MTWLPVGLASGVVALAISRGSIFAPLRARLTGWPEKLVSCYLCLGFWISGALTALQWPDGWVHPLVAWWAAWSVGSLLAAGVDRLAGE